MSGPRRAFHITLHQRPSGNWRRGCWNSGDETLSTLDVPAEALLIAFPVTFEDVSAALSREPRMYLEPDGSFVWVSTGEGDSAWQLDGMLFDRAGKLVYVELKGTASRDSFSKLCAILGANADLIVRLVQPGVILDLQTFTGSFLMA